MEKAILASSLVMLAAGCVQGVTGFGLSLLAVPLLGAILGIHETVPVLVILSIVTNVWIARDSMHELRWGMIAAMLLPALAGVPIGIAILATIDPAWLKTSAGIVIAAFAICAAIDFSFMHHARIRKPYLFGFLSGIMNGSLSISGPPIIAYFAIEGLKKDAFRSNINAYFLLLNVGTLVGMFLQGTCGMHETVLALSLMPSLLLGTIAGALIAKHINERLFRRIALGLLLVSGAYTALT